MEKQWAGLTRPRHRGAVALALGLTVAAGLASRQWTWLGATWASKYPGDVLWAQAVYWTAAGVFPHWPPARVAILALAISVADEVLQLSSAGWVRAVQAHPLGRLLLGTHFSWADMAAYALGVALCFAVERWLRAGQ
jgi:uncharacterized membrane protein